MIAEQLQQATFTANQQREDAFFEVVKRTCPADVRRVLDLGCGDGSSTLRLAEWLHDAHITGVDLSPANINLAQQRLSGAEQRLDFRACDYATTPLAASDVIIADTVLHLIDVPTVELFHKVSAELLPGGRIIFSAPKRCAFNKCLTLVRRTLRLIRGRLTNGLIHFAAKQVHRGQQDDFLRERIEYMYIVPRFFLCGELEQLLASECGLKLVLRESYPHTSLGQMRHDVWVCEKID